MPGVKPLGKEQPSFSLAPNIDLDGVYCSEIIRTHPDLFIPTQVVHASRQPQNDVSD